jgi:hypothetical protein
MTNEESKTHQSGQGSSGENSGSTRPGSGAQRPAGTVDEDANPPLSDPDDDSAPGGGGTLPPQDTGAAIPPYEGRQTSAKEVTATDNPSTGGASRPEEDPQYRSPKRRDTPGGATASPADEQPAALSPESKGDVEGVEAPAQTAGTRRGEDKP